MQGRTSHTFIMNPMTKSLADIMANKWEEPPEMKIIKDYVRKKYNAQVGVKITDKTIVILVPNSALAGTLRMDTHKLQKDLKTNKRLTLHIGGNSHNAS